MVGFENGFEGRKIGDVIKVFFELLPGLRNNKGERLELLRDLEIFDWMRVVELEEKRNVF